MTKEKVLEVIAKYRAYFEEQNFVKMRYSHENRQVSGSRCVSHCHYMLDEMEKFIKEDRMDKVMRWLGFIQGVLWATGYKTIEELKNESKPDAEVQ